VAFEDAGSLMTVRAGGTVAAWDVRPVEGLSAETWSHGSLGSEASRLSASPVCTVLP
jgi:hypothetical protein